MSITSFKKIAAERPALKLPKHAWVLTNFGAPVSIHWARVAAVRCAMQRTGKTWDETLRIFEVRKIRMEYMP